MATSEDMKRALDEVRGADNTSPMGPCARRILEDVAANGMGTHPWIDGVRDVLTAEVDRACVLLIRIAQAQHEAKAASWGVANQQRHEAAAELTEMAADCEYLLQELRALTRPPFTAQRLSEILLRPMLYHVIPEAASDLTEEALASATVDEARFKAQVAALRPTVLVHVIRKCALVTPTDVA